MKRGLYSFATLIFFFQWAEPSSFARGLTAPFVCPGSQILSQSPTADQKRRMMELTSTFENGDPQFHYDYIENLDDGRGYTVGRVGFCSANGDLIQVIRLYNQFKTHNELLKFTPRLEELARTQSDSTVGLEGFPEAWRNSAQDPEMICAQDTVVKSEYYAPAMKYADQLGITLPFGKAIFYDTFIMHGSGEDGAYDGTIEIISRTTATMHDTPTQGSNERLWLDAFLDERKKSLQNPKNEATHDEWSNNAVRADDLKAMLDSRQIDELDHRFYLNNTYYKGWIE